MNPNLFKIKFLENLCSFENKPLKLYDYQKRFLNDGSRFRIVNKARQLGYSLIIAAEGLMECLINPNYTVLFVSTGEEAAKRILDYVYDIINGMPDKIRPRMSVQTKTEIRFLNRSKLVSLPNNPKTSRGYRAHRVYIDEAAHFVNDEEIFASIQPSISRGGSMTLLSTPFGRSNSFFRTWDEHKLYSRHTTPWTDCPDPEYHKTVQENKKDMDEIEFKQEYLCQFCSDDLAYFPYSLIKPCVDDTLFNMTSTPSRNMCRMGYDPGGRIDSGCITITEEAYKDDKRMAIVLFQDEYLHVTIPDQLKKLDELYNSFKPSKICLDETSMGIPISEQLIVKYGGSVDPIRFHADNKEAMISGLRILFEQRSIRIPNNERLIFQLMNMERTISPGGKIRFKHAGKNQHDDRVWSLCLSIVGFISEAGGVDYILGEDTEMAKIEHDSIAIIDRDRPGPSRREPREETYGFVRV